MRASAPLAALTLAYVLFAAPVPCRATDCNPLTLTSTPTGAPSPAPAAAAVRKLKPERKAKQGVAKGDGVVVTLNNGSEVNGIYLGKKGGAVWLGLDGGEIGIESDTIVSVLPGKSADVEFLRRKEALDPKDTASWWELSQWAASHELFASAQSAAETVLDLNPNHGEARVFLGFELINGRWLDFAGAQRAKGFILFEGEWRTADDLAQIHNRRTAENQQRGMHANDRVIRYSQPGESPTSPAVGSGYIDRDKGGR